MSQRGFLYSPFFSMSSAGMRAWKGGMAGVSSKAWVITGALCLNCRESPAWRGALREKVRVSWSTATSKHSCKSHCHPALLAALIHELIRDRAREVSQVASSKPQLTHVPSTPHHAKLNSPSQLSIPCRSRAQHLHSFPCSYFVTEPTRAKPLMSQLNWI